MNKPASFERIAFVASETPEATDALARLTRRYGNTEPAKADVIVGLGGDGLMLQTLHRFMTAGKPIYGMHRGTVGFLMNDFNEDDLKARLAAAQTTVIHPLVMRTTDIAGAKKESYAINEVSVFRQSYQAARLRIIIDGKVYHGVSGAAGELGHMIVWFNGPRCPCGERGCLEAIASGMGLAWRAQDLVDAGEARGLERIKRERGELNADEVADAARAGDADAIRLFDEAGLYLGIALSNYINIFNPEMVVIGGGVAAGSGELFLPRAEETMRELAREEPLKYVRLQRAVLGDRSGPLGMIAALGDMVQEGGGHPSAAET